MARYLLICLLCVVPRLPAMALEVNPGEPAGLEALDIGIVVLHPGYEGDSANARSQGIFPAIRDAEANYLPYALRRTLVDANHWGAVRVLPDATTGSDVLLTGRILRSDGATLQLQLQARDSRGASWFKRTFSGTAGDTAYQAGERRSRRPFQQVYDEIARQLLDYRRTLREVELQRIRDIAELRYANGLLPAVFGPFLSLDEAGQYRALRLPSGDDPMLKRVRRIREQEYLFIDTVDEQYAELYTEMTPVYDLWRQFQREQLQYREAYEDRLAQRDKPRKGSYQALKQTYNNYRWAKLQRQEIKLLARGFDNEVAPTSVAIEGRVFKLAGSLDERYREWRRILQQIYVLETGMQ